ncbi:unnamed protein product [Boreogadus saida]
MPLRWLVKHQEEQSVDREGACEPRRSVWEKSLGEQRGGLRRLRRRPVWTEERACGLIGVAQPAAAVDGRGLLPLREELERDRRRAAKAHLPFASPEFTLNSGKWCLAPPAIL